MKAPDKIYLHKIRDEEKSGFYEIGFKIPARGVPSVKYIREDAIIQAIETEIETIEKKMENTSSVPLYEWLERESVCYQHVLAKIRNI